MTTSCLRVLKVDGEVEALRMPTTGEAQAMPGRMPLSARTCRAA